MGVGCRDYVVPRHSAWYTDGHFSQQMRSPPDWHSSHKSLLWSAASGSAFAAALLAAALLKGGGARSCSAKASALSFSLTRFLALSHSLSLSRARASFFLACTHTLSLCLSLLSLSLSFVVRRIRERLLPPPFWLLLCSRGVARVPVRPKRQRSRFHPLSLSLSVSLSLALALALSLARAGLSPPAGPAALLPPPFSLPLWLLLCSRGVARVPVRPRVSGFPRPASLSLPPPLSLSLALSRAPLSISSTYTHTHAHKLSRPHRPPRPNITSQNTQRPPSHRGIFGGHKSFQELFSDHMNTCGRTECARTESFSPKIFTCGSQA